MGKGAAAGRSEKGKIPVKRVRLRSNAPQNRKDCKVSGEKFAEKPRGGRRGWGGKEGGGHVLGRNEEAKVGKSLRNCESNIRPPRGGSFIG